MWNKIILRHGVTPWWNQIWLCQPRVHICFWPSTHSLLSLSLPSHFRNNVSYSLMYQKLINTLTQVDNTGYKCESVHYVCTNHIFDIDTNERLGSPKRNPSKHKPAQMSTTKSKWARTKAKRVQMNPNEREWKPNKNGDQQTNGDEHEGQPVQPSGDKWAGTNRDQQTNGDDHKWAAVSMNEWQRAQTRAGEHERQDKRERTRTKGLNNNNTTTTRDRGGRGSGSNGNGGSVSSSSSGRGLLPHPPAPPFPPFFILFFVVFTCILLCILNILMKRNWYL